MIIYICKFLHLISLFIAGGGGIGSAVIQSIYKKEGKEPEPHLAKGFKVLAFLSLLAIPASTFICKDKSINGPFFSDLGILSSSYLFFLQLNYQILYSF